MTAASARAPETRPPDRISPSASRTVRTLVHRGASSQVAAQVGDLRAVAAMAVAPAARAVARAPGAALPRGGAGQSAWAQAREEDERVVVILPEIAQARARRLRPRRPVLSGIRGGARRHRDVRSDDRRDPVDDAKRERDIGRLAYGSWRVAGGEQALDVVSRHVVPALRHLAGEARVLELATGQLG